jgi:nickel-type superoxide dismutase maturation protease
MEPTLRRGDWLLFDPLTFRRRSARPGELVVVPDPREPARWLVKRVGAVETDGRLLVAGDDPAESTDSRAFGSVSPVDVVGQPWFRYWPPGRVGRIR